MMNSILRKRTFLQSPSGTTNDLITNILQSRNLFNVQTIPYDIVTVTSMDLDMEGNFLLIGLSNGGVDLMEIDDPRYGSLNNVAHLNLSQYNLNRVQWSPTNEQFFSMLDNHDLYLVDPVEMRTIEKFEFNLKTNWSEWNPKEQKLIAVCGSESQVRLIDIRSGSSVQTVILGAPSRLSSHRATRCLWSNLDPYSLIVGDNEGYIHVYDIRHSTRPSILSGVEKGQISGMSFTKNNSTIITTQGTENNIVQWTYRNGNLKSNADKFRKQEKIIEEVKVEPEIKETQKRGQGRQEPPTKKSKMVLTRKSTRRVVPLPVDAYIRCQFHVTERHILCPVSSRTKKSKEIYVYDIDSGERIKTVKSEGILNQGVFSVTSLMPESMAIFVGGRGRLRVWSIDEDYQRKVEERLRRYHQTRWDSDED